MKNIMGRDIAYTHRRSEFTQDIFIDGVWLASAKNWSQADTVELAATELDGDDDDSPIDIPAEYPNPAPVPPPPPEWHTPSLYALLVAECQAELDRIAA